MARSKGPVGADVRRGGCPELVVGSLGEFRSPVHRVSRSKRDGKEISQACAREIRVGAAARFSGRFSGGVDVATGSEGTSSAARVKARIPMTVATIATFLGCGQVFFSTGYVQAPTRLEFCTTVLSFRKYNPLSAARITALALL
jgi:hypothetical protein